MDESAESTDRALFEFVQQFCIETAAGGAPSLLSHYLLRFPGHELAIAAEYIALVRPDARTAEPSARSDANDPGELWRRLEARRAEAVRYRETAEIARGGMGTIHAVRDLELGRDIAVKRVRQLNARALDRLLSEARITGRLDHPGVVPVHDLGIADDGRLFFTMRLVQGRDLTHVIEELHSISSAWTLPRVLEVLVKVCDTMAFAHSRGVVHRDLKPSNVRVGEFGEVYVLDWGLARDTLWPASAEEAARIAPGSTEIDLGAQGVESPLLTVEGDVLGTPYYMPPEQARGEVAAIDARADVYATGAMLYHLLAGRPPYASDSGVDSPREVLERVRSGPPPPIEESAPSAPRELASICVKAMRRDRDARYADMRDFGRDLRSFLERRVVSAHESGAWAELRAWARRNRALASSIGVVVALGVWGAWMQHLSDVEKREHLEDQLALREREQADLELFQDVQALASLEERFAELWPLSEQKRAVLQRWLDELDALARKAPERRAELAVLRERADPPDPNAPSEIAAREAHERRLSLYRAHRDHYEREMNTLVVPGATTVEGESLEEATARFTRFSMRVAHEEQVVPRAAWTFRSARDQTRHDLCDQYVAQLETLLSPSTGRGREAVIAALARPIAADGSTTHGTSDWAELASAISDPRLEWRYGDLELSPQAHLVPIGRDPESGLFEFACERTGTIPSRALDGSLAIDASSAVILVLIPGGILARGAQASDPRELNFDPNASADEQPVQRHSIEPFFLSKFELTRAQWERLAGSAPWRPSSDGPLEDPADPSAPASNISWSQMQRALAHVGLELPTEAQWEWAARSGGDTPWSCGADELELAAAGNVHDRSAVRANVPLWCFDDEQLAADDGSPLLAPIGSYCANAFGIHDMHGNVGEFCRDRGGLAYVEDIALGSLERSIHPQGVVIWRGGCYAAGARAARSSARHYCDRDWVRGSVGARPARSIER